MSETDVTDRPAACLRGRPTPLESRYDAERAQHETIGHASKAKTVC